MLHNLISWRPKFGLSKAGNKDGRLRIFHREEDFAAVYAMSDIHGCYEQLVEAHHKIEEDAARIEGPKLIALLGDYVDRGPDSDKVLEFLCEPPPPGLQRLALCGNHDAEFINLYRRPSTLRQWFGFAGPETLKSYGIDPKLILQKPSETGQFDRVLHEAVPKHHIDLLESLPVLLQVGRVLFVHAGVRPGIQIDRQKDSDLMWIRQPFLADGPGLPFVVVHGHTPSGRPDIGTQRIGIDTAVSVTGRLTILKMSAGRFSTL